MREGVFPEAKEKVSPEMMEGSEKVFLSFGGNKSLQK